MKYCVWQFTSYNMPIGMKVDPDQLQMVRI